MSDTIWSYRDSEWAQDRDLVGYDVEGEDGSLGKVDRATADTDGAWLVVDTGFCLEDDTASDFGGRPSRNALTLTALEQADEIVVVGAADPVGLARLARGLVDLRAQAYAAPVRVVVNRMRPSIGWSDK